MRGLSIEGDDDALADGTRVGRYVVLRDVDGRTHALATTAVAAVCADPEGGCTLLLPGGRMVRVDQPLELVLAWLGGQGPR
jgi:hypothetical protein